MLEQFSIYNWRGIHHSELEFSKNTVIIGTNGSGKTHILEAIHMLSGGNPQYFQAPKEDITSTFSGKYKAELGNNIYSLSRTLHGDMYYIDGKKVSAKKYKETLPYRSVFLSPFDMNLLYFAPAHRREYIDNILDRTFAQFRIIRREYENIMKQRNTLLKRIRDGESERKDLDFWDTSFAEKAYMYHLYRKKWYTFLENSKNILSLFLEKYSIEILYESKYHTEENIEEYILNYLTENRERDILTGHTHIGPHLDDFSFRVMQGDTWADASLYLSRGENKMLLLGLKQCEILFLKKNISIPILLLFDDLFAELDMSHAEKVITSFEADEIIITTQRELPKDEKWNHFSCINLSPE